MEKHFDLANVGRTNQLHSRDEASAIREAMVQRKQALERTNNEMTRLKEEAEQIEEELIRFNIALAPHNLLPNEILSRIFITIAKDHGFVHFPLRGYIPQLAVLHVCSHWRSVALRTSELWSNTFLYYGISPGESLALHQRWLSRARGFPVRMTLSFDDYLLNVDQITETLQKILLPFQVKKLCLLTITYKTFMAFSKIPGTALLNLEEFELNCRLPGFVQGPGVDILNVNNFPHHFATKLRSLSLYFNNDSDPDVWLERLSLLFPWSQLRSVEFQAKPVSFCLVVKILGQMPILQGLNLVTFDPPTDTSEELTQLTMTSLCDFKLKVDGAGLDKVLGTFTCPSLHSFTLASDTRQWTNETFEILKRHYNMQRLDDVNFSGGFALQLSSILQGAPMLRSLSLKCAAIIDDEAIVGLSKGSLGRFLGTLTINWTDCDIGGIPDMLEARNKMVGDLTEKSCIWKEEVTILRTITWRCSAHDRSKYKERLRALQKAGITVQCT